MQAKSPAACAPTVPADALLTSVAHFLLAGNASDNATKGDFGIPPRPVQYETLPAKLQARGDALDTGSMLARNAMAGRTKDGRPATPNRATTIGSSRPLPQLPAIFTREGGFDHGRQFRGDGTESRPGSASGAPTSQTDAPARRGRLSGDERPGMEARGSVSSGGSAGTSRAGSISQGRSRDGSSRSGGTGRRPSLASSAAGTFGGSANKRPSATNPYAAASAAGFWNLNGSSDKNPTGAVDKGSSPATSLKSGGVALDRSGATRRAVTPSGLTGAVRADSSTYPSGIGPASTPQTYSFPDRKTSTAPTLGGRATGGAAGSAGAWQAPDSWAVKPEGAASFDGDTDEEGTDDEDIDDAVDLLAENGFDSDESGPVARNTLVPLSGSVGEVRHLGSMYGESERVQSRAGRPSTGGGRPSTRNGRPGTADGEGRKGSQKPVSTTGQLKGCDWSRWLTEPVSLANTVHDPCLPRGRNVLDPTGPPERERRRLDRDARSQVPSECEADVRALHQGEGNRAPRRTERETCSAPETAVRASGVH